MQCDLPKEKLHEGETSTTTKTYVDLTKEILFMLGHKKKHLQKVHISVQSVKASMDMQMVVQDPCCNCVLLFFLATKFCYDTQGHTQNPVKYLRRMCFAKFTILSIFAENVILDVYLGSESMQIS